MDATDPEVGILEWPSGGLPPRAATARSAAAAGDAARWRPPTVADAAWLSGLGLGARPSLAIVAELARHRAAGRSVREEVEAIGLPRHAPHALRYRLSAGGEVRTWILGRSGPWTAGWYDEDEPLGWSGAARIEAAAERAAALPWLGVRSGDARALVGDRMAVLPLQRWGVARAVGRMLRPARPHDEVALLALGAERGATIPHAGLGPELAAVLAAIARRVWSHAGHLEHGDGPCGIDLDDDPTVWKLGALDEEDAATTAGELVALLDAYDDRIAPLLTTCEDWDHERYEEEEEEEEDDAHPLRAARPHRVDLSGVDLDALPF